MEYLEEHNTLRRNNEKEAKIELTPSSNRKNSDYAKTEINNNLHSIVSNSKQNFVIGICGGQSSGKSMISMYLNKHLENTVIVSEKDFFIGNKERRRSTADEKMSILNMADDDYSTTRKHRLAEVNNLKNFDWDSLVNVICQFKKGEIAKVPTWDKEKNFQ